MEYSAILDMFYGNKGQYDSVKVSLKYKNLLSVLDTKTKNFIENIKTYPNLLESYEEINKIENDLQCEECACHYVEGFKFGILMGIEIANNKN